jgi:hypothetical protein
MSLTYAAEIDGLRDWTHCYNLPSFCGNIMPINVQRFEKLHPVE